MTINQHVSKRPQGLSVGHYMLVAAINRCVCPKSKAKIGEWFTSTPLRRLIPATKAQLSSKRFWDNMGHLDADTINDIEHDLAKRFARDETAAIKGFFAAHLADADIAHKKVKVEYLEYDWQLNGSW